MPNTEERDRLCKLYYDIGMTHKEILYTLVAKHDIILSKRHLIRVLSVLNRRRRGYCDITLVIDFLCRELRGSGKLHGYRMMHQKCLDAGLSVRKEDVRLLLKALDPEGVLLRQSGKLKRRSYFAEGPNYSWHLDGYDKLKPFGLCIHGCIDGYSRKLIWVNVSHTNNDPSVIGGYFLEAVETLKGVPRRIRGDFGTENGYVRDFQCLLREDHTDRHARKPYREGSSTSNQRIEAYWAMLRRQCTHFWIDFFKDMQENDEHNGGFLDKGITQFCFSDLVQNELDTTSQTWNSHRMRPSSNHNVPSGRPQVLFSAPELWGTEDYLCEVSDEAVEVCMEDATFRSDIKCDKDIHNMCQEIVIRDNLLPVTDIQSAKKQYLHIRNAINALLMQ